MVDKAANLGVTLVIENIQDVEPATRREMVESFGSKVIALSVDTGAMRSWRGGAPPVD